MKRSRLKRRAPLRSLGAKGERDREELAAVRDAVMARARFRCERCDVLAVLEVHHLKPRSRGGGNDIENLAALCRGCHDAIHAHRAQDWREWIR